MAASSCLEDARESHFTVNVRRVPPSPDLATESCPLSASPTHTAMPAPPSLTAYIDFKSPFAYLAYDRIRALALQYPVELVWQPYVLDLQALAGPPEQRTERAQRKLRYSYMDARRQAASRGLVLRSPRKLFDGRRAGMGLLFALEHDQQPAYCQAVFRRFWSQQLDLDDLAALTALVSELGMDGAAFETYCQQDGPQQLQRIQDAADARGVFGVPTLVLGEELFWGGDRLDWVEQRLKETLRQSK